MRHPNQQPNLLHGLTSFREHVEKYARRLSDHTRACGRIVLEITPASLPVASLIQSQGKVAYLRQLATHRRAARAAQVLEQTGAHALVSTDEDRQATKKRRQRDKLKRAAARRHDYLMSRLPLWLRVCECAGCGRILLGAHQPELPAGPVTLFDHLKRVLQKVPPVARLRDERPWCAQCVTN